MHYYNEHDRFAAAWLRELIADGQIPKGEVDERSIVDVQPTDLAGFVQCHFFAGIGGWPYALRLAGWPEDQAVWTGSCPCQPFSSAGKQKGLADERHLWPTWYRLIRECKPSVIFGEQVEAAVRHGWLDGVFGDLEGEGYACGAAVLGAHSVSAPHIRQRLYWVANADQPGCDGRTRSGQQSVCDEDRESSGMANPETSERRWENGANESGWRIEEAGGSGIVSGVGNAVSHGTERTGGAECQFIPTSQIDWVGKPNSTRLFSGQCASKTAGYRGAFEPAGCACGLDLSESEQVGRTGQPRQDGAWADFDLLPCADGKVRRVESNTFPLVARLSETVVPSGDPSLPYVQATAEGRQMRLRGYGNAIVPQVAAEFIRAYMECERRRS